VGCEPGWIGGQVGIGQVGYRTGRVWDCWDVGLLGCGTGGMWDWWDV
jgi:hypothetical protein